MVIVALAAKDSHRCCLVPEVSAAFIAEHFRTVEQPRCVPAFATGDAVVVAFDVQGADTAFLWIDQREERILNASEH